MKRKKKSSFPVKPALLLGAAAVLLLGSTVGSTRAALTYYSEEYSAQVSMSSIGVTLLENDALVSERRYTESGTWETTGDGVLLKNMLDEGETPVPGKTYPEAISVANTGSIDTFVRVIINRYWTDASGEKTEATTGLSPDLIKLNLANEGKWIYDKASDYPDYSPERMVLYYSEALSPEMKTEPLSDTLQIDPSILNDVVIKETKSDDGTWIRTYAYKYDGYSFHLEAEVNAVQTHNAADAIKSAWGVDVTLSEDGTAITGINH